MNEESPTMKDVLKSNNWATRVKDCPYLDEKSLSKGQVFVKKFKEGWFAGKILSHRSKFVRSLQFSRTNLENGMVMNGICF